MRPSKDQYFVSMAMLVASRATCCRRSVGCVIVNARGHVLSTGYNGVASGQPHCNEPSIRPVYANDRRVSFDVSTNSWIFNGKRTPSLCKEFFTKSENNQCVGFDTEYKNACFGAKSASGTNLDSCEAIHAEQNALLQCRDVHEIDTVYCTDSPCITCIKLLMNTSCKKIVYLREYPHAQAKKLWLSLNREWVQYSGPTLTVSEAT